jgi:hypothetical protein
VFCEKPLALTRADAGARFLDRAREILAEIEDTEDAARGLDSLRGTLRLACRCFTGPAKSFRFCQNFLAFIRCCASKWLLSMSGRISSPKAPMLLYASAS